MHPNEGNTIKSKRLNPQSWVPINAPVVSILFSNFFGRTFFRVLFLFLVYYENYSKCTYHEVTVKLFSEPKIFEALHQSKMKICICPPSYRPFFKPNLKYIHMAGRGSYQYVTAIWKGREISKFHLALVRSFINFGFWKKFVSVKELKY